MLVTDDTSQLERSGLISLSFKNWYMPVTSEASKHLTMVSFEAFSDNFAFLLSLVNSKLIPEQGDGVIVGEDVVANVMGASVEDIEKKRMSWARMSWERTSWGGRHTLYTISYCAFTVRKHTPY